MYHEESYDGVNITKNGQLTFTSYNIVEALEQDSPRNTFLNGHLFVEMQCDLLLTQYFCKGTSGVDNRRRTLFSNFLKSRDMDYFIKIRLLKNLEYIDNNGIEKILDKKIYTSLKAVGAVRNAFHHNLEYEAALDSLTEGDKFMYSDTKGKGKKLSSYDDVKTLQRDFKGEAYSLFGALHDLSHEMDKKKNSF